MSNTPPIGHEDLGRGALNYPGYLYPGTGGLDYSSQLLGADQASGIGQYRQKLDPLLDNQPCGAEFRNDPGTSGRDGRASSRAPEDDGSYRILGEQIKTREMNLGLDMDYKGVDNMTKNGSYDQLRNLHGYSSEPVPRNYPQKAKDQQVAYPDVSYGLQHPQPQIDTRIPRLGPLLPTSGMFPPQVLNRTSQYDMLSWLPFPYGVDRRTNVAQSYATPIGLGQSGAGIHPLQPGYQEQDLTRIYGKPDGDRNATFGKVYSPPYSGSPLTTPKKLIDNDPHLMSRRTPHFDGYSPYLNSYSQSAPSYPDSSVKYTGKTNNYSAPTPTNGIRPRERVIDLTNSNSPDVLSNADGHKGGAPQDGGLPPLRDSRTTPKENGTHNPKDMVKGRDFVRNHNKNPHTNLSHYPTASLSPYSGRMTFPSGIPALSVPSYNVSDVSSYGTYDSSLTDISRLHPAKNFDQTLAKPGSHWPLARYHTPSPHQCSSLESVKRNGSPLLQSKSVPRTVTDLTFSYPESKSGKVDRPQSSKKYPANAKDNGMHPAKSQLWSKTDESKLSPYENEIMDCARDGKVHANLGKFDTVPHIQSKRPAHHGRPNNYVHARPAKPPTYSGPPENKAAKYAKDNVCERSRNSVIHSVPKLLPGGDVSEDLQTSDKFAASDNKNYVTEDISQCENSEIAENSLGVKEPDEGPEKVSPPRPGRKRKTSKVKDLEQRPKRKYTKRSEIWKNRGLQRQRSVSNEQGLFEPVKEPELQNMEPVPTEKSGRRQRKSGGLDMEEYLYGWFSEEETEKDDSSDEDYSCPATVSKVRGYKSASKLRATRTMPVRTSRDRCRTESTSRDEGISDDGESSWQRKTKRKGRKLKSLVLKESSESSSDKMEEKANTDTDMTKDTTPANAENSDLKRISDEEEKVGSEIKTQEIINLPEIAVEQEELPKLEPIRKKRKYTRRLDKDGLPIKRAKKVLKSVELIPRKKRKYRKVSEKWFRKKVPNKPTETTEENITIPTTICPSLAELYTRDHVNKMQHDTTNSTLNKTPTELIDEGKLANYGSENSHPNKPPTTCTPKSETSNLLESVPSIEQEEEKFKGDTNDFTKEEEEGRSITSHEAQTANSSIGATSNPNEALVKIKKKPGRKPGWRKYPQGSKENQTNELKMILKKKYKKPKGDGLPRFGMRKRGRKPKLRIPVTNAITSTPTRSQGVNKQEGQVRPKRKYNIASRMEKRRQFLLSQGRHIESNKEKISSAHSTPSRNLVVHKISKELQSQEYDYDFTASFLCDYGEDQADVTADDTSLVQSNQNDDTELPSSSTERPSTPRTPNTCTPLLQNLPFPASLKKLCCNTAIGETQLHKAARIGYIENLQYYLETGTNVNQSDNAGYTALHEACVQNNLEAASLLLQYGADVNRYAVDGTRPLHDAIEYDHLEMVRLMLSCGADPMLSKFSGRSIPNMIRSSKMRRFIGAYLNEIQDVKGDTNHDKELNWKFPCSGLFDKRHPHSYSALDFPPDANADDLSIEIELFENPPCNTYLLQPDDESERTNYCLLDDYLKVVEKQKKRSDSTIRVITMSVEQFRSQIRENKLQNLQYERTFPKADITGEFIELVAFDSEVGKLAGAEVVKFPLFDNLDTAKKDGNFTTETKPISPSAKEKKEASNPHQMLCYREILQPLVGDSDTLTESRGSLSQLNQVNGSCAENDTKLNVAPTKHEVNAGPKNSTEGDHFCLRRTSKELTNQLTGTISELTNSSTVDEVR